MLTGVVFAPKATPKAKNTTFKLDQVSTTKIEYAQSFLTKLGITNPKQRVIVARAIDHYLEYLDDLVLNYNCRNQSRESRYGVHIFDADIKHELKQVLEATPERESAWGTLELPAIKYDEFPLYLSYEKLVADTKQKFLKRLPIVRKKQLESIPEGWRKHFATQRDTSIPRGTREE